MTASYSNRLRTQFFSTSRIRRDDANLPIIGRIVIATKPVDFRKGHDGLAAIAQSELGFAPEGGVLMIIRTRHGDRIKILLWEAGDRERYIPKCYGRHGDLPVVDISRYASVEKSRPV